MMGANRCRAATLLLGVTRSVTVDAPSRCEPKKLAKLLGPFLRNDLGDWASRPTRASARMLAKII
jgi:hypothetical protein